MRSQIATILRESSKAIMKITIRERSSNIALNQPNLTSVDRIKGFSDADKQKVREIMAKNLEDGKGARGTAKDIENAFKDVDKKRAEAIARTGHNEMNSQAQWQRYKDKGFQSFTVIMADPCDDCIAAYDNVVFSIDDTDMLPPLHTHCMCTPEFHEETPEEYAEKYGYDVYDGSAGEDETEEISVEDLQALEDLAENIIEEMNVTPTEESPIITETKEKLYKMAEKKLINYEYPERNLLISEVKGSQNPLNHEEILKIYDSLPKPMQDKIEIIRTLDVGKPAAWGRFHTLGHYVPYAEQTPEIMVYYPKMYRDPVKTTEFLEEAKGILTHESGHAFDMNRSGSWISKSKGWQEASLADASTARVRGAPVYPTDYASRCHTSSETFAESVKLYFKGDKQFIKDFPNTVEYLNKLFM